MAKTILSGSLRKHPFFLALRPLGRSPRETSPAAKSEEKRMFSQAMLGQTLGWVGCVLLPNYSSSQIL